MKSDRLSPIELRIRTESFHPTQAKLRSGGTTLVTVMKAADLRQFDDWTLFRRLHHAPLPLLHKLQQIEREAGRQRVVPKGPRTLDIDILVYGDWVLESEELILPHPRMLRRRFVLEPLREIAPTLRLPGTGKTVEEAFRELRDPAQVRLLIMAGNREEEVRRQNSGVRIIRAATVRIVMSDK